MKDHDKELNAFTKSTNTKIPGILCVSVYCIMSYINLVFSLMYLRFIKPVWFLLIILSNTVLILFAIQPAAIL